MRVQGTFYSLFFCSSVEGFDRVKALMIYESRMKDKKTSLVLVMCVVYFVFPLPRSCAVTVYMLISFLTLGFSSATAEERCGGRRIVWREAGPS